MTATLDRLRVVRLDLPMDAAAFDAMICASPSLVLTVEPATGQDASAWQALSQAHVYHVASARDDMAQDWYVAQALLDRCPDCWPYRVTVLATTPWTWTPVPRPACVS
jgi:hypothetical protein